MPATHEFAGLKEPAHADRISVVQGGGTGERRSTARRDVFKNHASSACLHRDVRAPCRGRAKAPASVRCLEMDTTARLVASDACGGSPTELRGGKRYRPGLVCASAQPYVRRRSRRRTTNGSSTRVKPVRVQRAARAMSLEGGGRTPQLHASGRCMQPQPSLPNRWRRQAAKQVSKASQQGCAA